MKFFQILNKTLRFPCKFRVKSFIRYSHSSLQFTESFTLYFLMKESISIEVSPNEDIKKRSFLKYSQRLNFFLRVSFKLPTVKLSISWIIFISFTHEWWRRKKKGKKNEQIICLFMKGKSSVIQITFWWFIMFK